MLSFCTAGTLDYYTARYYTVRGLSKIKSRNRKQVNN
jgi:hypothetical protein